MSCGDDIQRNLADLHPNSVHFVNNKSQRMYRNSLEWIFKPSGRRIIPHTVTCNFELALINAIQGIFPYTKINVWKQAIKRKLSSLKLKNEKEIIEYAMIKYSINILTVIPIDEICEKGIPFVKDNLKDTINEGGDFQKMLKIYEAT